MSFAIRAGVATRRVYSFKLVVRLYLLASLVFTPNHWKLLLFWLPLILGWWLPLILGLGASAAKRAVRAAEADGKRRRVSVDAVGLWVDGSLFLRRGAIASAHCRDGHAVDILARGIRQSAVVYVDSPEEGLALVAALGVEPSGRAAEFRTPAPKARHLRKVGALLAGAAAVLVKAFDVVASSWWLALIFTGGCGLVVLPTLLPQRVEVGHDGVVLKWLGTRRFIAFSEIAAVVDTRTGVSLLLHGDRHVAICLHEPDDGAAGEVNALIARIKEGIAAQAGLPRADEEAILARGTRALRAWMLEMRALGAGEVAGYRSASVPRDRLWAIVESPAADASAREGAAIALSASLDASDRARLAAVARLTLQPRLRVALDEVSREQDDVRLRIALATADTEVETPDYLKARAASSRGDDI